MIFISSVKEEVGRRPVPFDAAAAFTGAGIAVDVGVLAKPTVAVETVAVETVAVETVAVETVAVETVANCFLSRAFGDHLAIVLTLSL